MNIKHFYIIVYSCKNYITKYRKVVIRYPHAVFRKMQLETSDGGKNESFYFSIKWRVGVEIQFSLQLKESLKKLYKNFWKILKHGSQ